MCAVMSGSANTEVSAVPGLSSVESALCQVMARYEILSWQQLHLKAREPLTEQRDTAHHRDAEMGDS